MKAKQTALIQLGTVLPGESACEPLRFEITEDLLKTHFVVFGGTRQGKSKLFEHISRQLIYNGSGLACIDPHSDTAEDLFAFLACHGEKLGAIKSRIHILNPAERSFSFDPFHYVPDTTDPCVSSNPEKAYRRWFGAKIKDMVRIITRKQGETEEEAQKMVRLQRWLFNGLYAVGVRLDETGRHLKFWDIWKILNP